MNPWLTDDAKAVQEYHGPVEWMHGNVTMRLVPDNEYGPHCKVEAFPDTPRAERRFITDYEATCILNEWAREKLAAKAVSVVTDFHGKSGCVAS